VSDPLDRVLPLAGAVPGVADARADSSQAVRVRVSPGADGADVALAVGRLLAGTSATGMREAVTVAAASRPGRARIERVDVRTDGTSFTVGVALACSGRSASGSAHSATTTAGTRRAVAHATLLAVEGLIAKQVHLELEHVERSDAGTAPVVLAHVSLVCSEGVQRLAGSAVVRDDETGAVVRAALDAVNRRVEMLVHTGR
jgi:hypothetical protein